MFSPPINSCFLVENCYTSARVPGKKIKRNLGVVQYSISGCKSTQPHEINNYFEAIFKLAKEKGANAVVNLQMNSGSYQEWGALKVSIMSFFTIFGDAVILEPDE